MFEICCNIFCVKSFKYYIFKNLTNLTNKIQDQTGNQFCTQVKHKLEMPFCKISKANQIYM